MALPTCGEVYAAVLGGPSFREDAERVRHPLGVSTQAEFKAARMLASRSHRPAMVEPLIRRLGLPPAEPCGSVGVKVARIASGHADLYAHAGPGLKYWDCCAPEVIVKAAGGRATDLRGDDIGYAGPNIALEHGFAVSNGPLHPGLLSAVPWSEREAARCAQARDR